MQLMKIASLSDAQIRGLPANFKELKVLILVLKLH
jgi:hypothetical protein